MKESIILKKAAYKVAEHGANQVCPFLFYQPVIPEKLKKLKK